MAIVESTPDIVTEQHRQQFQQEGWFLLKNVVPQEHLELLRRSAQYAIDKCDAEMDHRRVDVLGLNHRGKRYFSALVFKERPELRQFLFSDLMAQICQATLGPNAWLFWEQYVIKCADKGMKFSWHQDSGYVGDPNHKPYLTCWITLDDVTEENGTVYLLPYSVSGIRTWVKHIQEPGSNDLVGYFGRERGVAVVAPAGSIAVFSSYVFHSSGANLTNRMRRVYLAQYSAQVMHRSDTDPSDAFLAEGRNISSST